MDDHFPQHIAGRKPPRPEQQGDGQPENIRELTDDDGRDHRERGRRSAEQGPGANELPESGMGGTSDAGTAADEAAESANFGIGTKHDRTRGR